MKNSKLKRVAATMVALMMALAAWQMPLLANEAGNGYEAAYEGIVYETVYETTYEAADETEYEVEYEAVYEPAYEAAYQETYEANDGVYVDFMPLSMPVSTWAELQAAVADGASPIILNSDITLDDTLIIANGHDITITSADAYNINTLTSAPGKRHFEIISTGGGGTLSLENVILDGGGNGGGVEIRSGNALNPRQLFLNAGSIIQNSVNTDNGGGVLATGMGSEVTLDGGIVQDNIATGNGGGIQVNTLSSLIIRDGYIQNNEASSGGGVYVAGSTFTFSDGTIQHNIATGNGGGIFFINVSAPQIQGGLIYDNTASQYGGGVHLSGNSSLTMSGGNIYGNNAENGGGINAVGENATLILQDGAFIDDNTATGFGGGIRIHNATLQMEGGEVSNNHAENGGGVRIQGITPTGAQTSYMSGGTITGNIASNNGGGMHLIGPNTLFHMSNGSIDGNYAANHGGGIWLANGTATTGARLNMTGGAITNNTATNGDGGGIFTANHNYVNPVPFDTAYTNILAANGTFSGNVAGNGQFMPPDNAGAAPFSNGNLLNNYDINYHGTMIRAAQVTFILNGGNVDGDTSNIVHLLPLDQAIGSANVPDPARTDYVFVGWQEIDSNGNLLGGMLIVNEEKNDVAGLMLNRPRTFEAQWALARVVTFDLNGGNVDGDTADIVHVLPQYAEIGAARVPNPIRTNHTFTGWQEIDSDGNPVGDVLDPECVADIAVEEDMTFIAQWQPYPVVTFDLNGGNVNGDTADITHTVPPNSTIGYHNIRPVPQREGYTFLGWVQEDTTELLSAAEVDGMTVEDDMTFIAQWAPYPVVTFDLNGGHVNGDTADITGTVPPNSTVGAAELRPVPIRPGHTFLGWTLDSDPTLLTAAQVDAHVVEHSVTFTAQWAPDLPGGCDCDCEYCCDCGDNCECEEPNDCCDCGPTCDCDCEECCDCGDNCECEQPNDCCDCEPGDNNGPPGGGITAPPVETPTPLPPGTPLPHPTQPYTPWDPREPIYVPFTPPTTDQTYDVYYDDPTPGIALTPVDPMPLNPIHHAFMIGFAEDGTIRPQANITRAEVATIFFRLITDQHRANIWSQSNGFDDVDLPRWFNNPVSTMENGGLFAGIPLGASFAPNQAATRAEFAAMVVNYLGLGHYRVTDGHAFTDIEGHWAADAINVAFMQGWVNGVGDGTFRPDQLITRAEVAALVNRALGRRPETADDLLPGMLTWPDNANPSAWYYLYIQEATNSNLHVMKDDGVHKTWTEIIAPRNWRSLERPYSSPWDINQ